jgi:hypothetical protein
MGPKVLTPLPLPGPNVNTEFTMDMFNKTEQNNFAGMESSVWELFAGIGRLQRSQD